MFIVAHRNIFFAVTGLVVAASIVSLAVFGLKYGIDFTGGTLAEIRYDGVVPQQGAVERALSDAGFEGFSVRRTGESGFTIRASTLTDDQRENLSAILSYQEGIAQITQLSEVGPSIGTEMRNKALVAVGLVMLCILFFIAFAFRKVSKPVTSWIYGLIALLTLVHDVLIPLGFFAILGAIADAHVDALFVTAVLTILGYSVHDTIVVFDRVRENLRLNEERNRKEDFAETAGRALGQTYTRSINTSVTTLVALAALYVFGPAATKVFSLTLLVGILAGTYSSIFFATPLLVAIERRLRSRGT